MRTVKYASLPIFTAAEIAAFWSHVSIANPDDCWPWMLSRLPTGYGTVYGGATHAHRNFYAHRMAYMLATGSDPKANLVLHSCDNPPCCNPKHLSLGDHSRNAKEMYARGLRIPRSSFGESNPNSKLTNDRVKHIRELYLTGEWTIYRIAAAEGVCASTVCSVVNRGRWNMVGD